MKKNIGGVDKGVRVVAGLGLGVLGYTVSPWFYVFAVVVLGTALFGYCALYTILGLSTYLNKRQGE